MMTQTYTKLVEFPNSITKKIYRTLGERKNTTTYQLLVQTLELPGNHYNLAQVIEVMVGNTA